MTNKEEVLFTALKDMAILQHINGLSNKFNYIFYNKSL